MVNKNAKKHGETVKWGAMQAADLTRLIKKTRTRPDQIISIKGNPPEGLTNETIEKLFGGFVGFVRKEYIDYLYDYCTKDCQITPKALTSRRRTKHKTIISEEDRSLILSEFIRTGFSLEKLINAFGDESLNAERIRRIANGMIKHGIQEQIDTVIALYKELPDDPNKSNVVSIEGEKRNLTAEERAWMNDMRDIGLLPMRILKLASPEQNLPDEYTISRWLGSEDANAPDTQIKAIIETSKAIIKDLHSKRPKFKRNTIVKVHMGREMRRLTMEEKAWINDMRDIGLLPTRIFKLQQLDQELLNSNVVFSWIALKDTTAAEDNIKEVLESTKAVIKELYGKQPK